MTRSSSVAAILLGASLPVAAGAQADPVVGCYDIELGPWAIQDWREEGPDSLHVAPPRRIVLDSVPAAARYRQGERLARPAPGSPPSIHFYYRWRRLDGDSVLVGFDRRLSGLELRLERGNDELTGTAHTSWSAVQPPHMPPQWAPAVARRVSCAAPIPEEWKDYRRFVREVRLDDSRVLKVGRPLPPGVEEADSLTWGRPVGLFAGARITNLIVTRDTLRRVTLHYSEDTPVDSLIRYFKDVHGTPVRQSELSASWHGRESDFRIGLRQWGRRGEPLQQAIEIRLEQP
jgi:hypothetical protein